MSPSWLDYFFCTGPISTGSATVNFSMDLMQYHLGRFIPFVWNRPIKPQHLWYMEMFARKLKDLLWR